MIDVFGPDRGSKRLDRVFQVERLAAQQHDVEFLGELVGLHRRRVLERHVAAGALDDEAGACKLGSALRPDQERHVVSSLKQPAAEIAADGAGADHENAHAEFLVAA